MGGTPREMVGVPAGDFLMGSLKGEGDDDEKPQHRVTFAQGFWMGRYPVTQAQWKWGAGLKVVEHRLNADPSGFKGPNRPVEKVSWDDAQEFCCRLSRELSQAFKLPSEAQWEYACRSGTTTPFAFGKTLTTDLANYDGNSTYGGGPKGEVRAKTTGVGQFPANQWGLHDMHGNVREWCEDAWHEDYEGAASNGGARINNKSTSRLLRGGSWFDAPGYCRSAWRGHDRRDDRYLNVGFRVVCSPR
ncbi:MAG: formylglycine-generating enzyme family protein [Cyanophyceae cyanobacterium]